MVKKAGCHAGCSGLMYGKVARGLSTEHRDGNLGFSAMTDVRWSGRRGAEVEAGKHERSSSLMTGRIPRKPFGLEAKTRAVGTVRGEVEHQDDGSRGPLGLVPIFCVAPCRMGS